MKLLNKLKTNYQLSNVLVRILFVLGFIFCNWQDLILVVNLVGMSMGMPSGATIPLMLLSGTFTALLLTFVVPFAVNTTLNFMRLQNVPRYEFALIALLFFDIGFFACGLLNLVNLFTPVIMTWGSVLFPVVISAGCTIGFYAVTSKLYFNDTTRPDYFKHLAIAYLVIVTVTGVLS